MCRFKFKLFIAFAKKFGAGLFGGEGFILQKDEVSKTIFYSKQFEFATYTFEDELDIARKYIGIIESLRSFFFRIFKFKEKRSLQFYMVRDNEIMVFKNDSKDVVGIMNE